MNQYVESVSGLMEFLTNQLGKTDNFQCEGKCTCGATLVASLHVTGLIEE
jgi:hypothetical protein